MSEDREIYPFAIYHPVDLEGLIFKLGQGIIYLLFDYDKQEIVARYLNKNNTLTFLTDVMCGYEETIILEIEDRKITITLNRNDTWLVNARTYELEDLDKNRMDLVP